MPIAYSLRNAKLLNKLFTFLVLLLTVSGVFASNISVNAQIGMEPFGINKSDPKETGWFIYNVNAGDTIEDSIRISNLGAEDENVLLQANDGMITEDGAFTIVSNEVKNTGIGSWIDIKEGKLTIPAQKALKVDFKIQIPKDAKPGEYAGGLSVTPISKDSQTNPLSVVTRMGNRIYLTVKGDLNVAADVKDLKIMSPKVDNLSDEIRRRAFIKPSNFVFSFSSENTGNVYEAVNGKYKITLPDGKVIDRTFVRNLAPGAGAHTFYIETNEPYQVGKTTLDVSYEVKPQNEPKDPSLFKTPSASGTLNQTLDLSTADLKTFQDLVDNSAEAKRASVPVKADAVKNAPLVSEQVKEPEPKTVIVTEKADTNNNLLYFSIGIGVLLLILIGLLGYKVVSDSKKNKPVA